MVKYLKGLIQNESILLYDFDRQYISQISWAIGAVSGALGVEQEEEIVKVSLQRLLDLCEGTDTSDNKAVAAGNIMFIIGQYPRFLSSHCRLFKIVVRKLFEFMHERHPGVMDMACDTFSTICEKCGRDFSLFHGEDRTLFIEEIINDIGSVVSILELNLRLQVYDACGICIAAAKEAVSRDLIPLISLAVGEERLGEISPSLDSEFCTLLFENAGDYRALLTEFVKASLKIAERVGRRYTVQFHKIYGFLTRVYINIGSFLVDRSYELGERIAMYDYARELKVIQKDILSLVALFISTASDNDQVFEDVTKFLPDILQGYQNSPEFLRNPSVLVLISNLAKRFKAEAFKELAVMVDIILPPTVEMISRNYTDYPEHRAYFFKMVSDITEHSFDTFSQVSDFDSILGTLTWAATHEERSIFILGTETLLNVVSWVGNNASGEEQFVFFEKYFGDIYSKTWLVLTDLLHKECFSAQSGILYRLVSYAEKSYSSKENTSILKEIEEWTTKSLGEGFPNISKQQSHTMFDRCVETARRNDEINFRTTLRDFLVEIREDAGENYDDLFDLEMKAAEKDRSQQENPKSSQKSVVTFGDVWLT